MRKENQRMEIQCVATSIDVDGVILAGMSIAVPEFRYSSERNLVQGVIARCQGTDPQDHQ
jgi:hypothetical protein